MPWACVPTAWVPGRIGARPSAEVAAAATERGRKLDLWPTVAQLLVELER